MNWRWALVLFGLVHGTLLGVPDWALGYAPGSGTWGWGLPSDEIQMRWYGQALAAGLAFAVGARLPFRCPDALVAGALVFDLGMVIGSQIVRVAVQTS